MLQIVCVKVGEKFRPEYVTHLQNGLRRHLHAPFSFACLTDDPSGLRCRTIPILRNDLTGWWHKVTLFSGDMDFVGNRVLYFDLDVVLTGDITPIIQHPASFATLRDRWQKPGTINSSFMLWNHDEYRHIYDEFDGPGNWIGDQNYITTKVDDPYFINDAYSEWVKSFKADLQNQEPISDERLVYFHGLPRPWELEWVHRIWNRQKQS